MLSIFAAMKINLSIFLLFAFGITNAQKKTNYYDWEWKDSKIANARFVSMTEHTDSGWIREDYFLANKNIQMEGLYSDSLFKNKNGYFTYYFANGIVSSKGRYLKNEKEGLWFTYHYNGMMRDSTIFKNGETIGTSLGWFDNGFISDSATYKEDGTAFIVNWFDDGQPSAYGRMLNSKKEGQWTYFHKNGRKAAIEEYKQDKVKSRIYYKENGEEIADTSNRDREATFKGGQKKWASFLLENLQFPANVKLVNTKVITVVVAAMIDEEGNIKDPYIDIPFDPLFDNEALRIIKQSPAWNPKIEHNRKVRMYVRQPISFAELNE